MILMFFLKAVVVLIILWAGAYGGNLTPSFALGMAGAALLGMILGLDSQPTVLLLGSVCFLSVTLRAPISATGLVIGLHWGRFRFSSVSLSNSCFSLMNLQKC